VTDLVEVLLGMRDGRIVAEMKQRAEAAEAARPRSARSVSRAGICSTTLSCRACSSQRYRRWVLSVKIVLKVGFLRLIRLLRTLESSNEPPCRAIRGLPVLPGGPSR
jgi:hypothetical protein